MRTPRQTEPEKPGEWQREPGIYGRRYRMVGNIKEYEAEIMTTHGNLTVRQLEAMNKNKQNNK